MWVSWTFLNVYGQIKKKKILDIVYTPKEIYSISNCEAERLYVWVCKYIT